MSWKKKDSKIKKKQQTKTKKQTKNIARLEKRFEADHVARKWKSIYGKKAHYLHTLYPKVLRNYRSFSKIPPYLASTTYQISTTNI